MTTYDKNSEDIKNQIANLLVEVQGLENWAIGLNDVEGVKKWRKIYSDLISIEFNL